MFDSGYSADNCFFALRVASGEWRVLTCHLPVATGHRLGLTVKRGKICVNSRVRPLAKLAITSNLRLILRRSIIFLVIVSGLMVACYSRAADQIEAQPGVQEAPSDPEVETSLEVIETATPAPTVGGSVLSLPPKSQTPTQRPPTATPLMPTATPAPSPTPVPSPTPLISPMPLPTPPTPLIDYYQVKPGDTLGGISFAYGISIDDLVALNGLESESAIIQVGQTLHVPLQVSRTGPIVTLIPDSEVVYGPAYVDFDVAAFLAERGGFLATYSQQVNGEALSGAEMVERVARQYSVGPRVLLALLEFYGGWVTQPDPELAQPLGPANPYGENLFLQLSWAANRINEGYYGYKRSGSIAVQFRDRSRAIVPARMNAGTAGLQNVLALQADWETWLTQVKPDGFMQTYRNLFGDPFALAVEPLVPINLTQPELSLPWEPGQTFYYSGGPHAAYGDGSSWAAIDFGPPDVLGSCFYSGEYITAAADGQIILGQKGEMYLDLDADGKLQTGWVLLYLHLVSSDGLTSGQFVTAGTPLGYASCEGGFANSSHLHFARRYNGEWMAAAGPVPLVLSAWQVQAGLGQYEGEMAREGVIKTACECWDEEKNALVSE